MKLVPSPSAVMVLEAPAASILPAAGSPRRRKGKNFTAEEECTLCRAFLAVSQGPVVENGQKTASMWERVATSFNERNQPHGLAPRSARSLESKWGTIKHDVSFFVGCHASVESSKEFTNSENVIEKALELYRSKHPRGGTFIHLHCWRILHEVPQWCDNNNAEEGAKVTAAPIKAAAPPIEVAAPPAKILPNTAITALPENEISVEEEAHCTRSQGDDRSEQRHPKRLRRVQVDKEAKVRECALRAQARAMADMAAASRMKAEILADQSALQLFTLPLKDVTEPDAREYLILRRQEEIFRMRRRLLAQTAGPDGLTAPSPHSSALPEDQSLKQPTTGNSALSVCSRCERQYQTS